MGDNESATATVGGASQEGAQSAVPAGSGQETSGGQQAGGSSEKSSVRTVPLERFQQVYSRMLKAERLAKSSKEPESTPQFTGNPDAEKDAEIFKQKFEENPVQAIDSHISAREARVRLDSEIRKADEWVMAKPEFKTDPDFDNMMGFIIRENKFNRLDPMVAVQLAYKEYQGIIADIETEAKKATEEVDKPATSANNGGNDKMAQTKEDEKKALGATGSGGSGGSGGNGAKSYTRAQIQAMSASEYKEHRDAIKKAMREGRVKD